MSSAVARAFRGKKIKCVKVVRTFTVKWKQGSFFGFGGDRSQKYKETVYKITDIGNVTVFIESGIDPEAWDTLDDTYQYGLNQGTIFFVLHNKNNTPYQHRFVATEKQLLAQTANEILKAVKGVDLSWIAGDYLHNL